MKVKDKIEELTQDDRKEIISGFVKFCELVQDVKNSLLDEKSKDHEDSFSAAINVLSRFTPQAALTLKYFGEAVSYFIECIKDNDPCTCDECKKKQKVH